MKRAALFALCCAASLPALAADEAPLDIGTIAGVYKERFDNSDVDNRHFQSETSLRS